MNYLYWYLGIGVAALVVVFGAHLLEKRDESPLLRDLLQAVNPDSKTLSDRILSDFVVPALAALAVVVAWPVAVYLKIKDLFAKKAEYTPTDEPAFEVETCHLKARVTVAHIEACEVVSDPLGAVSNLPFGHLNSVWNTFKSNIDPDDEIWSFTAPWKTTWGHQEIRAGYVIVHHCVPGSHFLTMWKHVNDWPEDIQSST